MRGQENPVKSEREVKVKGYTYSYSKYQIVMTIRVIEITKVTYIPEVLQRCRPGGCCRFAQDRGMKVPVYA
jgi:hypothetical protein